MYLKKASVENGITTYHCKSKSQAKRWLRAQGFTKPVDSKCEKSFAFVESKNPENYVRLFWRSYSRGDSGWTIHHLPPGV